MIIKDLREQKSAKFGDLKVGDTFTFNDYIYIKIDNCQSAPNAYNITIRDIITFTAQTEVKYVPSELILHSPDWEEE